MALIMWLGLAGPVVESDGTATVVCPDRLLLVTMQVAMGSMVAGAAFTLMFGFAGMLYLPDSFQGDGRLLYAAGFVLVVGGIGLWKRFANGNGAVQLRLAPDGFDFFDGTKTGSGTWEQAVGVRDRVPGTRPRDNFLDCVADGRRPAAGHAGAQFAGGDARPLRNLVRYYRDRPESRGELTDGRAVDRLCDAMDQR
ncbi:MAG: hypothetical protein U0R77_06320 [Mycolicibacterium insubricum]|nr:hypothetical protein [Mycobacterium sp.]